jgi:hypothetical protein
MAYIDIEAFISVRKRHEMYGFGQLATLIPAEALRWVVVRSFLHPVFALRPSEPSAQFNPKVTALVCEMQEEADHEYRHRTGREGATARTTALFLSLALDLGGNKLMNCSADEARSRLIVDWLRSAHARIRAGHPAATEILLLRQNLEDFGCGQVELAA